ncbi:hypothetical protein [Sinomonas atrocyanea]
MTRFALWGALCRRLKTGQETGQGAGALPDDAAVGATSARRSLLVRAGAPSLAPKAVEPVKNFTDAVPGWFAETVGAVAALALALVAVAHLDATDRSWMLYYDSDSVLPALVRGSVLSGQPQDWFLSAVLFIPEMGLYFVLGGLGLGVKGTFALSAVVNLVLFYASLRFLCGLTQPKMPRSTRIAGALVGFAALMFLTLLEDSPRGDTFELASLLATTTYYGMTVLASVGATALAAGLSSAPGTVDRRWQEAALVVVCGGPR